MPPSSTNGNKTFKVKRGSTGSSDTSESVIEKTVDKAVDAVTGHSVHEATLEDPLVYTPIDEIPKGVQRLVTSFHEKHKLHSIQFRLNQLRNIYFAIKNNEDLLVEALERDFHRSSFETKALEFCPLQNELLHTITNLHKWAKPEKVHDLTINVATQPVYIERIPFGTVLVIAPFNYPLLLAVSSIVAAISGGNNVVLKLPESTPHFSQLLTDLLYDALDEDIFFVVNGGVPETTVLLDQKFDKIMYTGSTTVGKIIAAKAAETLTPTLLELGGKSPGFVLDDVKDKDLPTIAKRILWGKFSNAGQTCVAIDYLLVAESVKTKLIAELIKQADNFFPSVTPEADITHIIHDRAFSNLIKTLKNTSGKVIYGGESDAASKFISPTIITDVTFADSTMQQENFGPLLPIISYTELTPVLKKIIQSHDSPLAQYVFTSGYTNRASNPQLDTILTYIRSGATIINDTLVHVGLPNAPFGGIGTSGTGAYHGWYSFRAFTHERTTIEQALWNDFALKSRYPPFSHKNAKVIKASLAPQREWFNESGDVKVSGPSFLYNIYNGVATVATIGYNFVAARTSK